MKKFFKNIYWFTFLFTSCTGIYAAKSTYTDVLIIGGGASGTSAAVKSSRLGVKTILIEESSWLGGMLTSAGVSAIDGNNKLPSGFWGEFKDSLINYYGGESKLATGWVSNVQFEPSAGNSIFQNIARKEKNLSVYFNSSLLNVSQKNNQWIARIKTPNGEKTIKSKVLIDATELGDVAKMTGVKYDIGMESRFVTGEPAAPEKANDIIQDLTYVAILKDYHKDVTIPRPKDYDSTLYICSAKNPLCTNPEYPQYVWTPDKMITYGRLPNNKYMINWPAEGNDYYVNIIEMTPAQRTEALKKAKSITTGFLYFIQKELGMNTLGLADDEYPTDDKMPYIPYHRESRRIHGLVRFTENHLLNPYDQSEKLYRTAIAVGDYPVDHHHRRYTGNENIPQLYFHPVPSYGLPLGTLIPQNVEGLIVAEKSISVSNIVNGTTRLQPVILQIGDAAGTLAALAVKQNKRIQDVSVRDVQNSLLEKGGYLLPYLDVPKSHPAFLSLQRVGSTGILKGVGKNAGWSNETWFRADDILRMNDLEGLKDLYPDVNIIRNDSSEMYMKDLLVIVNKIMHKRKSAKVEIESVVKDFFEQKGFQFDQNKKISRIEAALVIDKILDPFNAKTVNIKGEFLENK